MEIQEIPKLIEKDSTLPSEDDFIFDNDPARALENDFCYWRRLWNASFISSSYCRQWTSTTSSISALMDDFAFMMKLWCHHTKIIQQQYFDLPEVLKLLKNISSISLLSHTLTTFKENIQAQLRWVTSSATTMKTNSSSSQ